MIDEFLEPTNTLAIVGASKNLEKYGHTLVVHFKQAKYKVIPINPSERDIEGLDCYERLEGYSEKIDVVIFVVPPEVTLKVLESVKKLKIDKVWMQPGSESKGAIKFCKDNNIKCIHNQCILVNHYKG